MADTASSLIRCEDTPRHPDFSTSSDLTFNFSIPFLELWMRLLMKLPMMGTCQGSHRRCLSHLSDSRPIHSGPGYSLAILVGSQGFTATSNGPRIQTSRKKKRYAKFDRSSFLTYNILGEYFLEFSENNSTLMDCTVSFRLGTYVNLRNVVLVQLL